MAKILIGFKLVTLITAFFGVPFVASIFISIGGKPPEIWYHISMIALLLPEILYVISAKFREHVAKSFVTEEQVPIKSKLAHYTTAVCLKLFGIVVVTEVWYDVNVAYLWKVSLLLAAFGIEGFNTLRFINPRIKARG